MGPSLPVPLLPGPEWCESGGLVVTIGLETIMERTVIAIDIAKKQFQLHWVEPDDGSIERLKLKRAKLLEWFATRPAALVVMEACGGAHDWARSLFELGHEVRLISPRKVRPFVQRNKTDAADAQAIWTASQQPGMRFVPVKTEAQQIVLSLHRLRAQLMKSRIMQTNELRGLLYEFGVVLPEGHAALLKALPVAMCEAKLRLHAMLMDSLDEQVRRIQQLQADIDLIEHRLSQQMRELPACKAIAQIPGIGLLTATAVVASMGTPSAFKDGREFAAWVGLVPRQTGTGGRVRQLGISKRGDVYLRTLLMHGARSVVNRSMTGPTWPWLAALLQRRPYSVAVAAVANKLARTIWAVLARGQAWRIEAWQVVH
jgi:transposase